MIPWVNMDGGRRLNGFLGLFLNDRTVTFLVIFLVRTLMHRNAKTETVLSNKITVNKIVLSVKDSPRKPLRRRPSLSRSDCCD